MCYHGCHLLPHCMSVSKDFVPIIVSHKCSHNNTSCQAAAQFYVPCLILCYHQACTYTRPVPLTQQPNAMILRDMMNGEYGLSSRVSGQLLQKQHEMWCPKHEYLLYLNLSPLWIICYMLHVQIVFLLPCNPPRNNSSSFQVCVVLAGELFNSLH